MVNLVEDWEVLEEYAGEKLGFYQELKTNGSTEIRITNSRFRFKKEFKEDEEDLARIRELCRKRCFIRVSEHLRDEDFFK